MKKVLFLLSVLAFVPKPSFAQTFYLICQYKAPDPITRLKRPKIQWDWAQLMYRVYFKLDGEVVSGISENGSMDTFFLSKDFTQADLTRVCNRHVQITSFLENKSYRLVGIRAGTSALNWDYPIQFRTPVKSKYSVLSSSEIVEMLIPDRMVNLVPAFSPAIDEAALDDLTQYLSDMIQSRIDFLKRVQIRLNQESKDLKDTKEKLLYLFYHSSKPEIQSHAVELLKMHERGRSVPPGLDLTLSFRQHEMELWFDRHLGYFESDLKMLKRINLIQDFEDRRISLLAYLQKGIWNLFSLEKELSRFHSVGEELLPGRFQAHQSHFSTVMESNLFVIYAKSRVYFKLIGQEEHMARLERKVPRLKVKRIIPKAEPSVLPQVPVQSQEQPLSSAFTSPPVLVPAAVQSQPKSTATPQSDPQKSVPSNLELAQALPFITSDHSDRLNPKGMREFARRQEQSTSEDRAETQIKVIELGSDELEILQLLENTAYRKKVKVNQFVKLFRKLIEQNPKIFQEGYVENKKGSAIRFGFKMVSGGWRSYVLHRPHGHDNDDFIPPPYRDEYLMLFHKVMGVTSKDIRSVQ